MVSVRERIFLVSGADFPQRQKIIENIKKRILERETAALNTLTIYCNEIDLKDLREKILTVSFGQKRLVIFKDFLSLKPDLRKLISANIKKILVDNYFIFETDQDSYSLQRNKKIASDVLFKFILAKAAAFKTSSPRIKNSIEDLMRSIRNDDFLLSLDILEHLFQKGANDREIGPQIIGILNKHFSFWKDSHKKEECFRHLWEADRSLKEKGLGSRVVLEMLLVKLSNLKQ